MNTRLLGFVLAVSGADVATFGDNIGVSGFSFSKNAPPNNMKVRSSCLNDETYSFDFQPPESSSAESAGWCSRSAVRRLRAHAAQAAAHH